MVKYNRSIDRNGIFTFAFLGETTHPPVHFRTGRQPPSPSHSEGKSLCAMGKKRRRRTSDPQNGVIGGSVARRDQSEDSQHMGPEDMSNRKNDPRILF